MKFVLSITKVVQLNKLNHAGRTNKDWPSRKAHEVMTQLVKEYEPDDTMAEMEMGKALSKLTLGKKKDPNNFLDEMSAIECRYKIDLTESKKKAQVFQIGGAQYSSIISTTQMIYKSKGVDLTCKKLLEEMHNQWQISGAKNCDEKDLDNEDKGVAATVNKDGEQKTKYVDPDKAKTCNHCKKNGHTEKKCWKKHLELIPDKVKVARKKQVEKKVEKASTVATAIPEDEIVLNKVDLEKSSIELSSFDMNDAFNKIPIDEDIVYLKTVFKESSNEESNDGNCDNEESDDKSGNNNDNDPPILDLSLSAVANVIADATFTTGAHILESQDIWIADIGATSHVTKHTKGGRKHHQTNVWTRRFAGETIQPDCEIDIRVTYVDVNGTEKFNIMLGDIQTNKKINYNLFNVTKMLLKGYKLKGNKPTITVWNQTQSIVFDLAGINV